MGNNQDIEVSLHPATTSRPMRSAELKWGFLMIAVASFLLAQVCRATPIHFRTIVINNVNPRRDTAGHIIDAHDGCLKFFNGRYYLYGTA